MLVLTDADLETKPSKYPLVGGLAFSLPYLAIWIFTLYLNLKVLPRVAPGSTNTSFNLWLNAGQFLPLIFVAFFQGCRLAALAWAPRKTFIKKTALVTVSFVGYEVLLILGVLIIGSIFYPSGQRIPLSLWFVIPLAAFVLLSVVFSIIHTISGSIILACRPSKPISPLSPAS